MERLRTRELTQRPQEDVRNQCLAQSNPASHDPTTPGRRRIVGFLRSELDERPNIQKTQTKISSKRYRKFKLKASWGSPVLGHHFSTQLERFLATLMMADHRIVGSNAASRIQIADCTLPGSGPSNMQGWTTVVYSQLSLVLSCRDQWERRFRSLEVFIDEHGRLPRRLSEDSVEKTQASWLNTQAIAFRNQMLPLHRFHRLLSASSPLIRRRAEGWQTGDTDGHFKDKCDLLREYVQLHQKLPQNTGDGVEPPFRKLANWLTRVRGGNTLLNLEKMKMLQEVHPLVKAELQKWQDAPRLQQSKWERNFGQLSGFVLATGRLPKSHAESKAERHCYDWLCSQCRKLIAGYLPDEMIWRLRNAHPLIAKYMDEK